MKWFDWHRAHGENVSKTCRHFGISRSTLRAEALQGGAFYHWKKRYDPQDLTSLEDRSCRPKRVRRPTWSLEMVAAVKRVREKYPRWGKSLP